MKRLSFAALFMLAACHHSKPPEQPTNNYAEWSVAKQGDTCTAFVSKAPPCPEGTTCDQSQQFTVDCPEDMITPTITIVQPMVGGSCYTQPSDGTAPQAITCPRPQQ